MAHTNKKSHYNVAKVLHWVVAFIAVMLLMSGWRTESLELEDKLLFITIHSGLGSAVLVLMLTRWWWRRKHNLYSPRGWYKRPSMLVQWLFYPLLLLQPILGILQSAVNQYDVRIFGLINISAVTAENKVLFAIFHQIHTITAITLSLILLFHIIDKSRRFFIDDSNYLQEPEVKEPEPGQ